MERRTIGSFIAALRKANGMTQKDLAERLHVSDKTVSRWECNDGTTDLSLIPVIAEIFGVTCDELLRRERKPPTERMEPADGNGSSLKGDKQRQRILKSTLSQYRNLTYIAIGISAIGLIGALICNLAILKALGFLVGSIFFVVSIVCQAIFLNRAFLRVEDADLDGEALSIYRKKVIFLAEKSIGVTAVLAGFTFPLLFVDAYIGLVSFSLLFWCLVTAAVFLVIYAVILYFLNAFLLKKGVFALSDAASAVYNHNHRLKKRCAAAFAILVLFTLLFHGIGAAAIWSYNNIASSYGTVFEDYESFTAYMEQDVPFDQNGSANEEDYAASVLDESAEWYDENGNVITDQEDLTATLEDANGNVVCTFIQRNKSVASILYTPKEGTVLPLCVLTGGDYLAATKLSNRINAIYCVLYPLELLAVLLVYSRKRAK